MNGIQAMVIAAARVLARRHAEACNVDPKDVWNLHAEDFIEDSEAALTAAGVPALLEALRGIEARCPTDSANYTRGSIGDTARAAIARATGEPQ